MNSQQLAFVLVINEAGFLEPVHEKANARPGSPYHFRQCLVADRRNRSFWSSMPIIVGELQEDTRQSFLAQAAVLVYQILLVADVRR